MRRTHIILTTLVLLVVGLSCSTLPLLPEAEPFPASTPTTKASPNPRVSELQPSLSSSQANPASSSASITPDATVAMILSSSTPLAFSPSITPSLTPGSTNTPGPTDTPSRRATRTPTITPTPPIPGAEVQFLEPGPMSKVVSPVHLIANARSIPSGTYHVELWIEPLNEGQDPRLLYRDVARIISNPVDWMYLSLDIQFELSRVSELGQLRVSVYDQYDRPVSINSVDLLLLSMGASSITPSNVRTEPIVIRQPAMNQLIQGGKLIVSGLAKPSEEFMLVQLVGADGSVVGYRQVFVTPAADGSYVPYSVEVPYQVTKPMWVRLMVSESGTRITGIEHLASVEVYLSP